MSTPTPRTDAAYAKWQEGWDRTPFGPDFARKLERELATELAKERALLDWLEENAGDIQRYNSSRYIWSAHQNLRAVIDAAMKKETK